MAANAIIDHTRVIEVGRCPAGRGMADVTLLRRRYVIRGFIVDMTAAAGTHHISVIDLGYRNPGTGSVAILAHIAGQDMIRTLIAVVTADTVTADIGVVVRRRSPCTGPMTVGTDIAAIDMIRRLTDDRVAVVAAEAGSHYLGMVDLNGR